MLMKEWMANGNDVTLILHPRRFGKCINLSMLKTFFSFGAESKEFSKFWIGQETDFMEKHCDTYPVVLLDMKGIKGNNWQAMLKKFWIMLEDIIFNQVPYF
jgi:Predicted AAA-ATPase